MQNSLHPKQQRFQFDRTAQLTKCLTISDAVAVWNALGTTSFFLGTIFLGIIGHPVAMALSVSQEQATSTIVQTTVQTPSATIAQASDTTRRTLRSGSRGDDVRELQAALKLLGYFTDTIDGVFGSQTETAVRRFQAAAGTTPDGIVGAVTWSSLFPPASTFSSGSPSSNPRPTSDPQYPTLRRGDRGAVVERLQQRLQVRGFLQGSIDGVFGADTETSVKAAQRHYGLEPDGIVGASTWNALSR